MQAVCESVRCLPGAVSEWKPDGVEGNGGITWEEIIQERLFQL